jgi:hypothetical protein
LALPACKTIPLLPGLALALRKSLGLAYAALSELPAASRLLITEIRKPSLES